MPRPMARACIGTSGWNYPEWKNDFYAGVPRRRWLAHYASRFDAVEANATFYRTIRPETLARWRDETPAGFRFAVKGHRMATHHRRLRDVGEVVLHQRASLEPLAGRTAVVLWQLPARLGKDVALLESFARVLGRWGGVRHVVEFRDASWFDDETAACLAGYRLGSAISDAGRWPRWDAVTTDLAYVRLHGRPETYRSAYAPAALADWAERARRWLAEGRQIHIYFDNTMQSAAHFDALQLTTLLQGTGDRG